VHNVRIGNVIDKMQENLIIFLPLMLSIGIVIYFTLPFEPEWFAGIIIALIALNGIYLNGRVAYAGQRVMQFIFIIGLVACAGFMSAQVRTYYINAPAITEELRGVHVNGIVERIDRLDGRKGSRVLIRDVHIDGHLPENMPEKVRIRIIKDDHLEAGQRISVRGELLPPPASVMPGGFDFQRWAFYQKIGAVGYAYYEPKTVFEADFTSEHQIERIRKRVEKHIYAFFGAENQTKAEIVTALITGRKTQMTDKDKEALRDAGLAHMLAISGLHIGLIVSAVFFFCRLVFSTIPYVALYLPSKKIAAMLALFFAVFYVLLSGASLPAVRAVIMMGIAMFAIVMDRNPISLRLVAFAALVILILLPESILSVSFQLSFAAVASLVIFYERTRLWWQAQYAQKGFLRRCYLYGLGVVATTVVSTVATAAPGLYHFNHFGVYGALSNLFAVPILAIFVMPSCLLAVILWPFGGDALFLKAAGYGAQLILDIAHYCANLPLAVLHQPYIGVYGFVLWTALGCFIWYWSRQTRLMLSAMVLLASCFLFVEKQYNIIIPSDFKLISVKDDAQRLLAYGKSPRRFDKDYIAEYYGRVSKDYIRPKKYEHCDPDGCLVEMHKGVFMQIVKFPENYVEACRKAAFVVLDFPLSALSDAQRERGCRVPMLHRFDTWRYGSYGIYVSPQGDVRINSLYSRDNYKRPWSQPSWR
jgi:competence protein ComEC